ncbi:MAG: 1-acyl-sn-glycerol-3-phosphate acyltransferase [Prevotellaceae bacterium]|nr:1-acyl-sn-glycerol-3-phosphate acyltransferase [Prevotellaceae bacterium]
MDNMDFDEIRPYNDDELPQIFEELIADSAFRRAVGSIMPGIPFADIAARMRASKTKLEFQQYLCYEALKKIIHDTTGGVSLESLFPHDRQTSYTYISNHRDIILDSGFLSMLLVENGMDTVEIAIGDNLLVYPWIKKFVRVNKCFIVQRALTMHQMLESSRRMSRYMHYTIKEKKQSIWIAQREGRAKDSNDTTQDSLLKMFAMGGDTRDIVTNIRELNIVPLTISYEYDPCDYLKAQEFQLKRDNPDYKKTTADDLLNMQTGLMGYKGHICYRMAGCINEELDRIDRTLPKAELYLSISSLIDRKIHANYRIYAGNYIAHDLLTGTDEFAGRYTPEEKRHFVEYIDKQLSRITIPGKDEAFLRGKLLLMYANPLTNHLVAIRQ